MGWPGFLSQVSLGYLYKVFLKQFLTVFKDSLGMFVYSTDSGQSGGLSERFAFLMQDGSKCSL